MIVLGNCEPRLDEPRVIKQVEFSLDKLIDTDTVVIDVPNAAVMVTFDVLNGRVRTGKIYYETQPNTAPDDTYKVSLRGVTVGEEIPGRYRLLGHFWQMGELVAVYAGFPKESE